MTKYFEDFLVGDVIDLGSVEVTEAAIIEFAREFDPQPFHIDPEAALETPFGGLIASGWHTCALFMRLMCDGMLNDSSSQGSSGMEELRWLKPVRPGDTFDRALHGARCAAIVDEAAPRHRHVSERDVESGRRDSPAHDRARPVRHTRRRGGLKFGSGSCQAATGLWLNDPAGRDCRCPRPDIQFRQDSPYGNTS